MQYFVNELELFLFGVQVDNETEQSSLVGGDLLEVVKGSTFKYANDITEVSLVSNVFDQVKAVPGKRDADLVLNVPLRNFAIIDIGTKPDFGKLLRCCDFSEGYNNGYWIYIPSSGGGESGTAWHYSGRSKAAANLQKAFNLKGDWKISGEAGKPGYLEATMKGVYSGYSEATPPTITRNRTVIPAIIGATIVINGYAYKFITFEISGNQPIDPTLDATQTHGGGQSMMTDRKIKMSAKVYMPLQSTVDPIDALQEVTEGAITLYWGASSEIKINASYSQITKVDTSEQNGVTTYDLELNLNRNDFAVRVLGANSSSSSSSSSSS